jgi:Zn-dependent protease/CBS domain-containing protein
MNETVSLGKVAGIRVSANWSLLVIFGLVVASLADGQLPHSAPGHIGFAYFLTAIFVTTVFYSCLLAHELAHGAVARRRHIEVEGIVLWLLGGVSKLKGDAADPDTELRIAIAGPVTSLALALGFFGLSRLTAIGHPASLLAAAFGWLGWTNGALAVFNLLPAFPLDGGRVLRSALWRQSGDKRRATATAGTVGRGFGYGFIVCGLFGLFAWNAGFNGLWFALIGWFLLSSSRGETALSVLSTELAGLRVGDAMTPEPLTVPAWVTLDQLWDEGVARRRHSSFPVIDAGGGLAGLVTVARMRQVPTVEWGRTTTAAVACPPRLCVTAGPDDDLATVTRAMLAAPDRRAVVIQHGRVVGIVSPGDVERVAGISARRTGGVDQPLAGAPHSA